MGASIGRRSHEDRALRQLARPRRGSPRSEFWGGPLGHPYALWCGPSRAAGTRALRRYGDNVAPTALSHTRTVMSGREACRLVLIDCIYLFGSPTTLRFRSDVVRGRDPFYDESRVFAYGSRYLTPEEREGHVGAIERAYRKVLAEGWLRRRGEDFWEFHRSGLATIGEDISRFAVVRDAVPVAVDYLLAPKVVGAAIWRRARRLLRGAWRSARLLARLSDEVRDALADRLTRGQAR